MGFSFWDLNFGPSVVFNTFDSLRTLDFIPSTGTESALNGSEQSDILRR